MNDRRHRRPDLRSPRGPSDGRPPSSEPDPFPYVEDSRRSSESGPSGGPRGERSRPSPPEQTGAETNYLVKNMEARTPMVVRLVGNEEVRGWIEYYDRQMIKINRREPPHLFIRKDNIKYMYKDEDAR